MGRSIRAKESLVSYLAALIVWGLLSYILFCTTVEFIVANEDPSRAVAPFYLTTVEPFYVMIVLFLPVYYLLRIILPDAYLGERLFFSWGPFGIPIFTHRGNITLLARTQLDHDSAVELPVVRISTYLHAFVLTYEHTRLTQSDLNKIIHYLRGWNEEEPILPIRTGRVRKHRLGGPLGRIKSFFLIFFFFFLLSVLVSGRLRLDGLSFPWLKTFAHLFYGTSFNDPWAPYPIANLNPEPQPNDLQVLFLGNSLLGGNQVPRIVAQLAASEGRGVWFRSHLVPGATIVDHRITTDWKRTDGKLWDAAVIQPQSLELVNWPTSGFKELSLLVEDLKKTSDSVFTLIPWARKDIGESPSRQLLSQLEVALSVTDTRAKIIPAGSAWLRADRANPSIGLYATDGIHDTRVGAYLTAITIYQSLFKVDDCPMKGLLAAELGEDTVRSLCEAAHSADTDAKVLVDLLGSNQSVKK